MAPRKRKADAAAATAGAEGGEVTEAVAAVKEAKKESTGVVVGRVTRSSARLAKEGTVVEAAAEKVPKKKAAAVKEKAVKKKAKVVEKKEEEVGDEVDSEEVGDEVDSKEVGDGKEKGLKTIVIEHCKQCNAFKTRAFQVKEGLEKAIDGIQVLINPEKPRRGCFEIREEGGETFISLLDMKRPFPPLKALDMKKEISDIIEKIK